jgi:hypothetical protein
MIDDPEQRISARSQIAFLESAADQLGDDYLGFSLAEEFDCRELGLLYYVMASSDTLGDALSRAARYSRITNEAIALQYQGAHKPALRLTYSGIPRHEDRHQIEFSILAMIRMSWLTGRRLTPEHVSLTHVRSKGISRFARFLGKDVEFGSDIDEIRPCNRAESAQLWLRRADREKYVDMIGGRHHRPGGGLRGPGRAERSNDGAIEGIGTSESVIGQFEAAACH